jgi:redox-sensing transcriptional repressor
MKAKISDAVVNRLPVYRRYLEELMNGDVERISSNDLSRLIGFTASQIRQDLNNFGGFGQQGYGYNIAQLYTEIGNILGLNHTKKAILIGAGNLGRAIATHTRFHDQGFDLIGVFDSSDSVVGSVIAGQTVRNSSTLKRFCRDNEPVIAILCVPGDAAPELVTTLISCGIKGFWNFTHYDILHDHPDVSVENVHLSDSLMTLRYQVKKYENEEDPS